MRGHLLLAALDKGFLLLAGQLFDLGFPPHGLLLGGVGFRVHQGDGPAAAGLFACLSTVVGLQAFFYVICPSSV